MVATASEIGTGRSLKRKIYGQPLLIWRDESRKLHVLLDCCAHKRAPLEVKDFHQNQIVCPYHGWEYDAEGALTKVPSSPDACDKLKCSLPSFPVVESAGFVWVYLGDGTPENEIPDIEEFIGSGWGSKFKTMSFETTEELLIDNFMDPTHTALVHDGLIRSSQNSTWHEMSITTHSHGVRVDYAEQEESVGIGLRMLFGRSMKVRHADEFLMPNLVKVTYWFNGEPRFLALIACTPLEGLDAAPTRAFVQLRYRFGALNYAIKPFLGVLANKVLKQDFEITRDQFRNMQDCPEQKEHLVAADAVAARVSVFRQNAVQKLAPPDQSTQTLRLQF